MDVGIGIPQIGVLADPAAVRAVAAAAERVGYGSLWSIDRPSPVASHRAPPAGAGRLDPLGVLTLAASVTERIRLAAGVIVGDDCPPAALARSLATLDVISGGRLTTVLDVTGGGDGRLDVVLDELGAAMLERTRPRVLLAASPDDAMRLLAHGLDGWVACGLAVETLAATWADVSGRAGAAGRDPLRFVVRAGVQVTPTRLAGDRPAFRGTIQQVAADLVAVREAGAHEVVLELASHLALDEVLAACAQLAEAVESHPC